MKVASYPAKASKLVAIAILASGNNWSVEAQDYKDCRCNPDPHFKTWDGTYYDFHGGCPLVLVHVPGFLDIHIDTVPQVGFSSIAKVGLRIGGDQVVIDSNTDGVIPPKFGAGHVSAPPGGYDFVYGELSGNYDLFLNNGQYVRVTEWYGSMSVMVHGLADDFSGAVGMCGSWNEAGKVDRYNGMLYTGDEMGSAWKVIDPDDDPIPGIGSVATCALAIPHGGKCEENGCVCDDDNDGTRCQCGGKGDQDIGACDCAKDGCVTPENVTKACEGVNGEAEKKNCEFDVKMTGDVTWGEAPFYAEPVPPVPPMGKSGKKRTNSKASKD